MATLMDEIKDAILKKKMIVGAQTTIKKMKIGKIVKVYLSSNCRLDVQKDIEHYAKLGNIELKVLDKTNEELGIICKKPFSISVLGIISGK